MGARSQRFFDEANRIGGIAAKARLASMAKVTSTEAYAGPDDDDVVERLRAALETIRGQYENRPISRTSGTVREVSQTGPLLGAEVVGLRRQIEAMIDLVSQRATILTDASATARRINQTAALVLDIARVSVWLIHDGGTKLSCLDLYERDRNAHSAGVVLHAKDFAPYFSAMLTERTIAASDAITDPRTSCFALPYLRPLGIGAMLDVPIWVAGQMVGVICHEHVGGSRLWTGDEERFGYLMSGLISIALERTSSAMAA